MKKVNLLLFLSVLSNLLVAQNNIKFNKEYDILYALPNVAISIIVCHGGYVIYGETKDSNNVDRISISKIDSVGNLEWAKSYGKKG